MPEDRQWPGPRCLRCEHFNYTCSKSCTKAEEASTSGDSTQSSGNASVRGNQGPEDINHSEPVKSSTNENPRLDGQLLTYDSEDLEPSTNFTVKTDDEL